METTLSPKQKSSHYLFYGFLCDIIAVTCFVLTFLGAFFFIAFFFGTAIAGFRFNLIGYSQGRLIETGEENSRAIKALLMGGNLLLSIVGGLMLFGVILLMIELRDFRWPG